MLFTDCLLHALEDTARLLPFLFLTYLVMEYLEQRAGERSAQAVRRTGRLGPLAGAALGAVPQCGFSAAASSLYSGGLITAGTLMAVFLSTSDEMLPIFISEAVNLGTILKILGTKAALGAVTGFLLDLLIRRFRKKEVHKDIHDLCEQDHCHCEEGSIVKSALRHTLQIALFLLERADGDGWAEIRMNREEMADFLGVARPSLSRTLMKMKREGLILPENKRIRILDFDRMEALCLDL